jgi:signal transduction histidine kinase
MATRRLPSAVNEILETPLGDDVHLPEVSEVPIQGGIEVARVADALNTVQHSAIDLAVEQAVLRRNIADSFVNLGRRNQNLLARQLEFISELEEREEDPVRLDQLFKLDHLATRMRRNAESLLVLAGLDPPRQWVAPIDAGDVARAALGEVEAYQRVDVQMQPALVRGSATADVSHILAELTENALAFSPPDTTVELVGRRTNAGYMFSVIDRGVGMNDVDLERANRRLAAAESFTVAPSRYLGHYVVAQLAARHGVHVWLARSPSGGVAAVVELPAAVLAEVAPADAPPVGPVAEPLPVVEPVPAAEPAPAPESTTALAPPPVAPPVAAPLAPPAVAPADVHAPLPTRARAATLPDDGGAEPDIAPELVPLLAPPPAVAELAESPVEVAPREVEVAAPEVEVAAPEVEVAPREVEVAAPEVEVAAPEVEVAASGAHDDGPGAAAGVEAEPGGDLLPHRKGRARRASISLARRAHRGAAPSDAQDAATDGTPPERFELPSLPRRTAGATTAPGDGAPELPQRGADPSVPLGFTGAPPPATDAQGNSYAFFAAFRAAADLARSDSAHDTDEGAGE